MRRSSLLPMFLLLLLPAVEAGAEELPYPTGRSRQTIEGLEVELGIPEGISREEPASLVVILHGAGGSATGMVGAMRAWIPDGYVVCAPKSKGQVWSNTDIEAVKKIALHLREKLPIGKDRTHVVGYSNGGWNLPPLAFDDDIRPVSATWIASGYRGASPPRWAEERLGVLALAGTRDANAPAARETVKLLRDEVRNVEARFEPGLGHEWPRTLMPYFQWWMGAQEGRFVPGEDRNLAWGDSIEKAVQRLGGVRKGGIVVYAWHADDKDKPHAKALQNEVLMDELARHYAGQPEVEAVKLDFAEHEEVLKALGVTETPAIAILKPDGKPRRVLMGPKDLRRRRVISSIRSVAPDKRKPD